MSPCLTLTLGILKFLMFTNSIGERYFILALNCKYVIPGNAEHVHVY